MGEPGSSDGGTPRPPWLLLAASAVLLSGLVAGIGTALAGAGIEQNLTERAQQALTASGLSGRVTASGRDLTVDVATPNRGDEVSRVVLGVTGVRSAEVHELVPDPAQRPDSGTNTVEPVLLNINDEQVALIGAVSSGQEQQAAVTAIRRHCTDRTVVAGLRVVPGVRVPWQPGALAALAQAGISAQGERTISWDKDGIKLSGTVPSNSVKTALEAAVRRAVPGVPVHSALTVARDVGKPFAGADELQTQIDQLLADSPVDFRPDSATMTPSAEDTLARVAQLLLLAKDHTVEVDGHAAPGPGGPQTAQDLSVRRANSVRDQLVRLGFPAVRIVANGLGDSQPKHEIDAEGGKAVNRRVEITVR